MSKIVFSKEDITKLKNNKNILKVSEYGITYKHEFKILFIDEYIAGKLPRQIFEENGFDINIIGYRRIEQSSQRQHFSFYILKPLISVVFSVILIVYQIRRFFTMNKTSFLLEY